MEKNEKIVIVGLGHSTIIAGALANMASASHRQLELITIDDAKDRIKSAERRQPLPVVPVIQVYNLGKKERKDKSRIKRYSSYWNKKK